MKKFFVLFIVLVMLVSFTACSSTVSPATNASTDNNVSNESDIRTNNNDYETTVKVPDILSQIEYATMNSLYNGDESLLNVSMEHTGIFVTIDDTVNNKTLYFIWGYLDKTKCCDWEWELDPDALDLNNLPVNGSKITFTGSIVKSDKAAELYWISNIKDFKIDSVYGGLDSSVDYDMRTMNATLVFYQLSFLLNSFEKTEGKTVIIYGRVYSVGSDSQTDAVQHPYYNNYWVLDLEMEKHLPAIGTNVVIRGSIGNFVLTNASYELSDFSF